MEKIQIKTLIQNAISFQNEVELHDFWQQHQEYFFVFASGPLQIVDTFYDEYDTFIQTIKGKYFMMSDHHTIDKQYQEMIKILISCKLRLKDTGIENYLKYFDPNSSYNYRIQALQLFRLLKNPQEEVLGISERVVQLLYLATHNGKEEINESRNILIEYIDRVFSIKDFSPHEKKLWITNTPGGNTAWDYWKQDTSLMQWIQQQIDVSQIFIDEAKKVEIINEKISQESESTKIKELEEQIRILQIENDQLLSQLAGKNTVEPLGPRERKDYKIDIILGSEKVKRKRNQLKKEMNLESFGISWNNFRVIAEDYDDQKKLKASTIKNNLFNGVTDLIIAVQTDHETEFVNILKEGDPEIMSHITVFAEDKEFIGQSLSKERLDHYLGSALEKYERYRENSF